MARPLARPDLDRARSNVERQQRFRERRRAEQEVRDRHAKNERERRARLRAPQPVLAAPPADLVEYVESLTITQGDHEGQPFTVLPWQREYLQKVQAASGGERGLSVAAGGGKTTLLGGIAAAGVYGPLAKPRANVLRSGKFGQALVTFDSADAFVEPLIERDPRRFRVNRSETNALIQDRETGATQKAREATPGTLHGAAPALVLADEPAQSKPTQRDRIYSALRSRLGKIPGARLLAIGTRSDDPAHWFALLLCGPGWSTKPTPTVTLSTRRNGTRPAPA